MSAATPLPATRPVVDPPTVQRRWHSGPREVGRYLRRNPSLPAGLALLAALLAFVAIGRTLTPWDAAFPLSGPPAAPPSAEFPLGTDLRGRDLLAVMAYGTLLTLKIGVIAGVLGVGFGAFVAFVAAYHRGWVDAVLRVVVDVLITVPSLLVLVVLASALQKSMTTTIMAFTVAVLAWREPARKIRAQVLVMREAPYIAVARLNGAGPARIIIREMMPNLLPYLCASLVLSIAWAILASIGLEALGLGTPSEPTLGMTIYWLMTDSAFMLGLWWWILAPIVILVTLFVGLYLVTVGLDELANPRLRARSS